MADLIRPAKVHDIDALCDLYYDFHELHVGGVPTHLRSLGRREQWDRTSIREALSKIIERDDSEVFVVEAAGTLVGLVEVHARQDPEEATLVRHRCVELQSLMVSAPFRRCGIGTELLAAARGWALEKGAAEIRLSVWEFNEEARLFYEAAGFRTLKRTMVCEIPA